MNDIDKHLDHLFNRASTQAPVASFEETSARFSKTIAAGGGASMPNSALKIIFSSKGIFSIAILSIIALALYFNNDDAMSNSNKSVFLFSNQDSTQSTFDRELPTTIFSINTINSAENSAKDEDANFISSSKTPEHLFDTTDTKNQHSKLGKPLQNEALRAPASPSVEFPESFYSENTKVNKINEIDSSNFLSLLTQINLQELLKSMPPVISKLKGNKVLFTLTELSTESEFKRISKRAKEAGITFKYQVHHQRKQKKQELFLVRDFKINMTIAGTNHFSQVFVKVPKRGKFEVTFGWFIDEQGKAKALTESVTITKATSFYPKLK